MALHKLNPHIIDSLRRRYNLPKDLSGVEVDGDLKPFVRVNGEPKYFDKF